MRTRRLGSSDLEVTVVGLGCNNFGGRIDEAAARAVIDAALDAGVTFFDTADVYGNRGGSEEIIGRALAGRRDQVVLATKFGHDLGDGETARGARARTSARRSRTSLRRLQTDRIDLYQYHRPDGVTPLAETLEALHELVQEGTVRAIGSSNFTPAHGRGGGRDRRRARADPVRLRAERVLLAPARRRGTSCCRPASGSAIGFIPYFPLASGLLTGKYAKGEPAPEGTRLAGRELADADLDTVERLRAFAERHGVSLLDVAIGGLAAVAGVASVIAGATKPEQVRANAAAGAWEPTAEQLAELRSLL